MTSLGGLRLCLDEWGIDAAYSGTQKCLSCPPGLSPVSFSDHALEVVRTRTRPVQSWYLDVTLLAGYFGSERTYHHTAPISAVLGLAQALRLVVDEGIAARERRHREAAAALITALTPLGFAPLVAEEHRLPPLTSMRLPDSVRDWNGDAGEAGLRRRLLDAHGIEVGGGLGPLAGKVWRVGLMGENATKENVERLVSSLEQELGCERR